MKVVKFGGSSLASGAQFQKVIEIINADPDRRVVVVSAPGKRNDADTKVTDLLIKYAKHPDRKTIVEEIWARYQEIADFFQVPAELLQPLKSELENLPQQNYSNSDFLLAAFKAHGEKINAQLLTIILQEQNKPAEFFDPEKSGLIVTNNPHDAHVLPQTYDRLADFQNPNKILVVPGFYGRSEDGEIATFSRGGSDITGAIMAKGLHADLYENFTDVDAVFAVNPQLVKNPIPIKLMTYRELRELSYTGFSVFHDEALIPTIEAQIPINVKNTNHPDLPGTLVVPEKDFKPQHTITGVASSKHFSALYLHRYMLNKEVGFTLKLLEIFYKYNISYEHMPSGIDDLTVIFDQNQFNGDLREQMCEEIRATLGPDRLEWIDDYAIIMVVGEGMRNKIGVLKRIVDPLAQANIGIHMINQGASRISIMLGTKQADASTAVKKIYQQFFESKE
ncbi:aspartate kinase [Xylocopilactobacillus apicola]|uniref:Aspartokinase n=1 Tax=Xylocopilactobacillus apicola TaxID=2932184 RepID=A0AAU9CVG3_9LACO|nr:aspartate kinase [Xylocopilactobacillus apicola]BDR57974.1 aspartokinase [Xylocopilactobacillus apicola]